AELAVLSFHLGPAANEATVLAPERLLFLGQRGQATAQMLKFPIAVLTAGAQSTSRGHSDLHGLCSARGRQIIDVLRPRCISIVRAESRSRNRFRKSCSPARVVRGKR